MGQVAVVLPYHLMPHLFKGFFQGLADTVDIAVLFGVGAAGRHVRLGIVGVIDADGLFAPPPPWLPSQPSQAARPPNCGPGAAARSICLQSVADIGHIGRALLGLHDHPIAFDRQRLRNRRFSSSMYWSPTSTMTAVSVTVSPSVVTKV